MSIRECIVVGGGIAGSVAAYQLARRGYEVTVLERSRGPHHKVCGEFLSHEGIAYLHDFGIDLQEAGMPLIEKLRLTAGRKELSLSLPHPGRGVSRYWLDETLLQRAEQAGACVRRGACVTEYRKDVSGEFHVSTMEEDFRAKFLFIAHGKHDIRHQGRAGGDASFLAFKVHLRAAQTVHDAQRNCVRLFLFDGGYAGVCPVENEVLNLCFIIRKSLYKDRGRRSGILSYLRTLSPGMGDILDHSRPESTIHAIGHIPYGFLRRNLPPNIFYLGDQRAVTPSFTGDGMSMAFKTAVEEVDRFEACRKGRPISCLSLQKALRLQLRWARGAHTAFQLRLILPALMALSGRFPGLIQFLFHKTRIPPHHL